MTGTALTEAKEFEGIYNLHVAEIPPNIQVNRIDKNDQIYMTKREKYEVFRFSKIKEFQRTAYFDWHYIRRKF